MRCRVHVRNGLSGQVLIAELTMENSASSYGRPMIKLASGEAVDESRYELLPFPTREELDIPPFGREEQA